jgi:F-type H+-transporting ATPase subunit delta
LKSSALGKRYAGALIALGQKDGQFERYGKELASSYEMLGSSENWSSFTSPLLPIEAKLKVIDELAKRSGWSKTFSNFLMLLVEKKRIKALPSIVDAYGELADIAAGRVHATVQSATNLEDATKSRLTKSLVDMLGKQVILDSKVDPSLIGGIRVQVGSKVYDGTIRGQLTRVKEFLTKD